MKPISKIRKMQPMDQKAYKQNAFVVLFSVILRRTTLLVFHSFLCFESYLPQILPFLFTISYYFTDCHAVGYSYSRFVGPVSGQEQIIFLRDNSNGAVHVDYFSKPDYKFSYGVKDETTGVFQNRKELREADKVTGVYSVVEPDGTLRIVKYAADNVNGFQAKVITNRQKTVHGQQNNHYNNNNHNTQIYNNNPVKWNTQSKSQHICKNDECSKYDGDEFDVIDDDASVEMVINNHEYKDVKNKEYTSYEDDD